MDLSGLSERLKALRGRLALTQAEVAVELHLARRTFQSWENGEVQTTIRNYERLASYYAEKLGEHISVSYLLFGRDQRPTTDAEARIEELQREMNLRIEALRDQLSA